MGNIPFLVTNADAATVYAKFWIEKIKGPTPDTGFLQLQYVQTVFLNFPLIKPGAPPVPLVLASRLGGNAAKDVRGSMNLRWEPLPLRSYPGRAFLPRRLDRKVTIRISPHRPGEPYQEIGVGP